MMIKKILPAAFLAIAAQFPFMAESEAAIFSLSWVGSGGYKLTGYFEYSGDSSSPNAADGVIRSGNNSGTNGNELTGMSVAFLDPTDTVLATYNLSQLLAEPTFNFNFDIATQTVLQTGASNSPTGFYLGSLGISGVSPTDYSLISTDASGGINFNNGDFSVADGNTTGTLTSQPIPFDFNPVNGVVALGTLFATKKVWQKFRAKKDMV